MDRYNAHKEFQGDDYGQNISKQIDGGPWHIAALCLVFSDAAIARNYSAERIFATINEVSGNFSRKRVKLGNTGFSFSTILQNGMNIWTEANPDGKEGVIARIYELENRDKLMIEVHHIRFPSFAEAPTAGHGFLALNNYNRIITDRQKSNSVFGFLAGGEFQDGRGYGRMARIAAISHGRDVLIIHAAFDYDDYPKYENALARFFGGLEMENESDALKSLNEETAKGGEVFLYPQGWEVKEADTGDKPRGTSDYNLSLEGEEYPNLVVHIRPVDLAKGREVAAGMISAFTKQISESPKASFAGEAEMETVRSSSGEDLAYSYARGWDTTQGGRFVTEIYVQKNAALSSISILGLNTYDVRRNIGSFDKDAQHIIFKGWVTGVSAYLLAQNSLAQDRNDVVRNFDLKEIAR